MIQPLPTQTGYADARPPDPIIKRKNPDLSVSPGTPVKQSYLTITPFILSTTALNNTPPDLQCTPYNGQIKKDTLVGKLYKVMPDKQPLGQWRSAYISGAYQQYPRHRQNHPLFVILGDNQPPSRLDEIALTQRVIFTQRFA